MTVSQLRALLATLPTDCDGLPVRLSVSGIDTPATTLEIVPPANWDRLTPCVTITYTVGADPDKPPLAFTYPRHWTL